MNMWNGWIEADTLEMAVRDEKVRVINQGVQWQRVCGPVAALVATTARLEWTVQSATVLITDEDKQFQMDVDPPAVIRHEVCEAVKRWRCARVARAFPQLARSGTPTKGEINPIYVALNSRIQSDKWKQCHRAAFHSTLANMQYAMATGQETGGRIS